ncbi:O-antigen ligase family protein [Fodinicola acaciae]|uniref:O-antigen ligase family protein n=1 Tax=Fodinicola acaciae TaxID=2681555 RepID=UPI0013D34FBC|nr:O-antigen ligase family protein [Fodinicola acaciae]
MQQRVRMATVVADAEEHSGSKAHTASRVLRVALIALLLALLIDVLLEGWVQQVFGHPGPVDARGHSTWILAGWPKTLKSVLFLAILGGTLAKVAVDRSWREFTTRAEIALAVVGVVMVAAGLLGGSSATIIGQALFVYFRGVIVFFAWRALRDVPVRPVLWTVGPVAVLAAAVAIVQFVLGEPAVVALGWTELTWAGLGRAQAFFNHPNHLGHFLMVVELALLCWFVTRPKVSWKLWLLFGFLALGMSTTQSRESALGFAVGAAVVMVLRRRQLRTTVKPVAVAMALIIGFAGMQLLIPQNQTTFGGRIGGVFAAVRGMKTAAAAPGQPSAEKYEIRVLFWKQGLGLLVHRPVLGYGVGQFGGAVAFQSDPYWYATLTSDKPDLRHPDFPPWTSHPEQVDSFWLHLVMETGVLGLLAYLVWMFFVAAPTVRSRDPVARICPAALVAAALLIAWLSPSLEDQLFPVLLFTVLGWAWTLSQPTSRTTVEVGVRAPDGDQGVLRSER